MATQPEDIAPTSMVRVTLADGSTIEGEMFHTAGFQWLKGGNNTVFTFDQPYVGITVLKTAMEVHEERQARKFGTPAFTQPSTRDQYEQTLWDLIHQSVELSVRAHNLPLGAESFALSRRSDQLEAQFNLLADQIDLSKCKRRYMQRTCQIRDKGGEMPHPIDCTEDGPLDALRFEPPKASDFDPDPKTRRKRSLKPAHAYLPKRIIEESLSRAKSTIRKNCSAARRAHMERLIKRRSRELENGLYREAVSAMIAVPEPESHQPFNSISAA